jgi:aminomethyltransferase
VLQKLTDVKLETIKNYWFTHGTVCGLPNTLIARTGYTGEDGFEIYVPSDVATSERVWNEVFAAGKEFVIVACGLGARNTLRLESKMALYEHEISEKIHVWEAGLERYCHLEKGEFIGRDALVKLKAEGLKRALVGLEMVERGIARDGYRCLDENGNEIGVVTSGSPSPTLGKNIALAYVPPSMTGLGTAVFVEIRTQKCKAQVVATPFYKRVRTPRAQPGMAVPR